LANITNLQINKSSNRYIIYYIPLGPPSKGELTTRQYNKSSNLQIIQFPNQLLHCYIKKLLHYLHPYRTAEAPCRIVGLYPVVVYEYRIVTEITKEGTSQFSDLGGRNEPAGSFGIYGSQFLQFSVLFFR